MKQFVNKNLISLKCVLFFFMAGVGCIYPFLPLHMLAVGLDKGEARLISIVAPCVAILGPAIVGPLVDKLSVGRGSTGGNNTGASGSGRLLRNITALCLILSAIFYLLLLAVPYTERHEARRPRVLFMCDEDGAYVMQEVCTEGMRCNRWDGVKSGVLAVSHCEYGCADDNMTWVTQPFTTSTTSTTTAGPDWTNSTDRLSEALIVGDEQEDGEEYEVNPPHLCTSGNCLVYMQHAARMRVPLALHAPETTGDNETTDNEWCTYRTAGPFQCTVPPERLAELTEGSTASCRPAVRCLVLDPYDEPGGVLADAQCRLVVGDPAATFWIYLVIRCVADIFPTAALALLGAACVVATRETSLGRGDVGRQLAAAALGLALLPPLAGLGAAAFPPRYAVPLLLHALCMLVAALVLLFDGHMPLSTPEWWWHTATGALALPLSSVRRYGAEAAGLFAVTVLLGTLCSAIDSYLPWTVRELNGTDVQLGLTRSAAALPAALALCWAEALVDYVGHSHVLILAFTFYSLRYTGLACSSRLAWVVLVEALEVFTLGVVWVTLVLYFRHLAPRRYTASGQALPVIAHFGIGRCVGAAVGGLAALQSALAAQQALARGLAVLALLAAALYFALYHLLLAPRCAAPHAAPPRQLLQGLGSNGASNGTHSPVRVYHEERSRKGHFRY